MTAEVDFLKGPREERIIITYDKATNTFFAEQITKFDEVITE
jgi:hypothetical protein